MRNLLFGDSSEPPPVWPQGLDGWAFYIGGDTPHIWAKTEVDEIPYRYRLPIYTRSDPANANAADDVAAAIDQLDAIGAPKGTLVALDSETSADPNYVAQFYYGLRSAGYVLIDYGSQSSVFGNMNPDGYYWGANWTNVPHLLPTDEMTQWESRDTYDESSASALLPFWDTKGTDPLATMPGEYYEIVSVNVETGGDLTVYGTGWADNPPHNLALYATHYNGTSQAWDQPVLVAEIVPLTPAAPTEGQPTA